MLKIYVCLFVFFFRGAMGTKFISFVFTVTATPCLLGSAASVRAVDCGQAGSSEEEGCQKQHWHSGEMVCAMNDDMDKTLHIRTNSPFQQSLDIAFFTSSSRSCGVETPLKWLTWGV